MSKRRKFTEAQKSQAVARVHSGERVTAVAESIKIVPSAVHRWVKESKPSSCTTGVRDAIILLKQAERSSLEDIRRGRIKQLNRVSLYASLALRSLTGEM